MRWVCGSADLALRDERLHQMLAWLGHQRDWVTRADLSRLLWPELPSAAARRNLRRLLFRLRELPQHPAVQQQQDALRWSPQTDVQAFEQALAAGDAAAAVALWRGEPWQGMGSTGSAELSEWLRAERDRLRALWRGAMLNLADAEGDAAGAIARARQLLASDELDEEALRLLLRACLRSGLHGEAHAAYRRFARALDEALGLQPTAATRALLQAGAPGSDGMATGAGVGVGAPAGDAREAGAAATRPVAPVPRRAGDLAEGTFVGRRAELAELAAMLADPTCRWLTIVGPGGTGKTSLMRHALPTLSAGFRHRHVYAGFDDLEGDEPGIAAVTDTEASVLARLADALGLPLDASRPARDQLVTALCRREVLLALDNLEQLPATARVLADLLTNCPGVRVVATSRARLAVAGEWLLPLQGMPWPAPEDLGRAEAFDAVRLFLQCARRHQPRLSAASQLPDVARLCEAVEGVPLALELAAVWTRHFSIGEIVSDLKRGASEMLSHPDDVGGEHVTRRRSLQASFEHSWRLLVDGERAALARLAVLRGSFARDAALEVGAASLALLAALQDKSLLRREPGGGALGLERYSLHPLIHQFARQKLASMPMDLAMARRRLAEHFGQRLASIPSQARPAERSAAVRALALDTENVAAAWSEAVALGRADLLVAAIAPLRALFIGRSLWDECLRMIEAARPLLARNAPALAQAMALRANVQYLRGEYVASVASGRAALRGLGTAGDAGPRCAALGALGHSLVQLGRHEAAQRCYQQGLRLAARRGNDAARANLLGSLAFIDFHFGRHDLCCERGREAIRLRRAGGASDAWLYGQLAHSLVAAGRLAEARALLAEGHSLTPQGAPTLVRANLLLAGIKLERAAGEYAAAQALAVEADEEIERVPSPALRNLLDLDRARLALALGHVGAARQLLCGVTRDALERGQVAMQAAALVVWGEWHQSHGESHRAAALLAQAARHPGLAHDEREAALSRLRALAGHGAPPTACPQAAPGPELPDLGDSLRALL